MPGWNTPPQVDPLGASDEIHKRPWVSTKRSMAPRPRLRVGFQLVARPVAASMSPMPGRDTHVVTQVPAPSGLSAQRWCPPMYTLPVLSAMTLYRESRPVLLTQIAGWFELEPAENLA